MIFNLISEKTISRIKNINVSHLLAVECLIMVIRFIKLLNTQIILQYLYKNEIMEKEYNSMSSYH